MAAGRATRSFEIGGQTCKAGATTRVEVRVARTASGAWAHVPVVVIHGARPGPTVWLSGAVHGDELNGVEIVRRLVQDTPARAVSGTLLAVPIVNVFGVTNQSRYLPDRRDLNRCFPGSSRGSLASRLARLFFDTVVQRCDFGLDFHTGSNGRQNLPHVRIDAGQPRLAELAREFAPPLVFCGKRLPGSLRAAAAAAGVPMLLFEGGEAHRFDEDAIQVGVAGAQRVLKALGVLSSAPAAPAEGPLWSKRSRWMRAGRSGFAHVEVPLGARVEAGQRVATVSQSTGGPELVIRSRCAGTVIGALRTALVHRGDALVHVAELQPGPA